MPQKAMKLLEHGLGDMYDAEQKFVRALGTMAENAKDASLVDGFRRHRKVTEGQVKRLEQAFQEIGSSPKREDCPAATGLVREYEKFVSQEGSGNGMLDAFAAASGLKVEHYEIASYRALIDLAQFCDQSACARLLKQNLAEEEQAAAEMQSAATTLSAKLADAPITAVAGRTAGSMVDQLREGTMTAMGGARSLGQRAIGQAKSAVETAERRGRAVRARRAKKTRGGTVRARGTSKGTRSTTNRSTSSRAKTTTARRRTAAASARTRTGTRKATTGRPRAKARTTARKTSSTARRTKAATRRSTTGRTRTARSATGRATARRRTTARRSTR